MRQIRASVFKARCLKIMNKIQSTGEPVVITTRGVPVVKNCPRRAAAFRSVWFYDWRIQDCRRH